MPNTSVRRTARTAQPRHQAKARTDNHRDRTWSEDRRDNGGRTNGERRSRHGDTWSPNRRDSRPHRDDRQPNRRDSRWGDNRATPAANGDRRSPRDNRWADDRPRQRDNRWTDRPTQRDQKWTDDRSRQRDRWTDRPTQRDQKWTDNRPTQRDQKWTDDRPRQRDNRWSDDRRPSQRGARWSDDGRPARRDAKGTTGRWSADQNGATDTRSARRDTGWTGDRRSSQRDTSRPDARRPSHRDTDAPTGRPAWDGEIVETPERRRPSVSFAELGLPTPLLGALSDAGIDAPFPIQAATLPDALSGRDVLGRAQTGSGKTLAFGLALLTRLNGGRSVPSRPRALVLVPTRELAMQVEEALRPLARAMGLWCRTVVGGMSFSRQVEHLKRGVDLLIATPGRLSDHVRQGTCLLDDVRFTALDEADQMADMGFLPQVRAILDLVPGDGQRMLFSATLDRDVAQLVDRYLADPVTHSVSPATAAVDTMDHHLLLVSREDKQAVVTEMAARDGRTIMFLRTKHHVDRLTKQLRAVGVRAGALHGGKPQGARNRVLGEFKDGSLPVLVATDVAARGIHVDGVSLVVHVDPPADAKGYLHRAGRTARAGEAGTVVTLVTNQERRTVFRMTEQAGVQPERTKVAPGDADLVRITGARVPSGEPVVDPEPTRRPPRTGAPRGRFGTRPGRQRPRRTDR